MRLSELFNATEQELEKQAQIEEVETSAALGKRAEALAIGKSLADQDFSEILSQMEQS